MNLRMLSTSIIFISLVIFVPISGTDNDFIESKQTEDILPNMSAENAKSNRNLSDKSSEELFKSNSLLDTNEKNITYNQDNFETISILDKSSYNPRDLVSINTSTTYVDQANNLDWSTDGYNNSYYYSLYSPQGELWFNSTTKSVGNNTGTGLQYENNTYREQTLNSSFQSNFTSYKVYPHENFIQNITFLSMVNVTPTVVKISFRTVGKAIGAVSYNTDNISFTDPANRVSDRSYINGTRTVYLRNLQADTQYYFVLNATDIFGNKMEDLNNGSYYSFNTTSALTDPFVQTMTVLTSEDTASISVTVAGSQSANLTVFFGIDPNTLTDVPSSSSVTQESSPSVFITTGLQSARKYFFKIRLMNSDGNTTIDDNDGQLYVFTTNKDLGSVDVNSTIQTQQLNSTHFTVQFTTSQEYNASVFYGITFDQAVNIPFQSPFSNGTNHNITIPTTQVSTTFFSIILSPDQVDITNINNSNSNYYTYTSEPIINVPQNDAYINITLVLPKYPAELGMWQFSLNIIKNNTETFELINLAPYLVDFLVNDTLTFSPAEYLMQRGFIYNVSNSKTFGNYVSETIDGNTVFSPGDNVSIVGKLKYSDNSTINKTQVPISGTVSLVYGNETISTDGNIFSLPISEFNLLPNLTDSYNNATYFLINFQIPITDIYGEVTIQTSVLFPGNQTYSAPGFTQVFDFRNITVQYLLGISNTVGDSEYFYTQRLQGSVTVTPYHWDKSLFETNQYDTNNYTRVLNIPGDELDVELTTRDSDGNISNILQVQKSQNTWFWLREHIDFTVKADTYTIQYLWLNNSRGIPELNESFINKFDENAPTYTYSFTIKESYGILDLTDDLITRPSKTVKLRFKVVVPETNISVKTDYSNILTVGSVTGISPGDGKATYSDLTSEYSIEITVADNVGDGIQTLPVSSSTISLKTNSISFNVSRDIDDPGTSTQTTNPVKDRTLSLTDYALIGGAIVAFVVYIAIVYLFIKRK
ncbi:MAG: hypothetical protein HeimC3_23250 [Candidatus Heimdallarchaeota archaeon LC_3]|nr:MAG: hypothetical protein HeimC3_23250 [Candidatus Heimdallarchaeota archaeon LC_3]